MTQKPSVLVIDDDPSHLRIYCLIIESAGLGAVPAQVQWNGVTLPENETVDAVCLDYCLTGTILARDVVQQVRARYPSTPILLLTDLPEAPQDVVPLVDGYVRKGNPEKLVSTLRELVHMPGGPGKL